MTAVICAGPVYAGDLTLWYNKPANPGMNEALPIGNGTFGGLIYAGPKRERVVLNEISLWTGTEISTEDYAKMGAYQMLAPARRVYPLAIGALVDGDHVARLGDLGRGGDRLEGFRGGALVPYRLL